MTGGCDRRFRPISYPKANITTRPLAQSTVLGNTKSIEYRNPGGGYTVAITLNRLIRILDTGRTKCTSPGNGVTQDEPIYDGRPVESPSSVAKFP